MSVGEKTGQGSQGDSHKNSLFASEVLNAKVEQSEVIMARGRMLDKVIILSKKINAVSEGAENLYYRLIVVADDYGRYHADSEIIKGQVYTKRRISLITIEQRLQELESVGLIRRYRVDGEVYLEIIGFSDHQRFRPDIQRRAEYPEPTGDLQDERNGSDTSRNGSDTSRNGSVTSCIGPDTGRCYNNNINNNINNNNNKTNTYYSSDTKIVSEQKQNIEYDFELKSKDNIVKERKPKIEYDFELRDWRNITEKDIATWVEAFPAVDVNQELKKMGAWLLANPDKKKKNYARFITNWLSKTQERGGNKVINKNETWKERFIKK